MQTGDFVKYQDLPAIVIGVSNGIASIAVGGRSVERAEVPATVLEPVYIDGRSVTFIHALMGFAANVGVNLEPGRGISRPAGTGKERTDE